jgi:predicted Zn-dependent protease
MRSTLLTGVALLALALAPGAFAAGGGGGGYDNPPKQAADPDYTRAKTMIEAKDYKDALPILKQLVARDPRNADAYTLIGYATRKLGDPNGSLQYYNTALSLDPKHIGAHEYIGEAYLMLDRPAEAEQQLARLDSLCIFGCTEYRMLKTAIANYKAGHKPTN